MRFIITLIVSCLPRFKKSLYTKHADIVYRINWECALHKQVKVVRVYYYRYIEKES
jgi:hypothetical protein